MKSKKSLLLIGVLSLSLLMPLHVSANTTYVTSNAQVSTDGGTIENKDVASNSDEGKCDVSVSQGSTFSVIIPKTVILNGGFGQANEASYTINVTANIASDEVLTVSPVTSFKMADVNGIKTAKDASVVQSITKFVDPETKNAKFSSSVDVKALSNGTNGSHPVSSTDGKIIVSNLTAGSWQGSFNFNISLLSQNF